LNPKISAKAFKAFSFVTYFYADRSHIHSIESPPDMVIVEKLGFIYRRVHRFFRILAGVWPPANAGHCSAPPVAARLLCMYLLAGLRFSYIRDNSHQREPTEIG
jgi:hypothetical protein